MGGQLIATLPLAISCYPGPYQNAAQCAIVDQGWTNASFQADSPVGLSYPIDVTCPPVNALAGQHAGTCTIGTSPRYAVNATSVQHVAAGVIFAKDHNVRLVIKDTGHDILGRSTGYGSLEIWIRHLRTGLTFLPKYEPTCGDINWTGSAFTVGGGYTWEDVYPLAQANNVVVVGGGTPTVSVLGGWMQGGGHGPATRQYGLGAEQVLSAQVVLADGSIVTASPCENQDIFFAIRGGGPGTYGVVTETTIKAHPNVNVQVQSVAIVPGSCSDTGPLLDAVTIMYAAFPDLNDAGYAGYGSWTIASPTPLVANSTCGYVHGFYTFDQSLESGQKAFAPVLNKLKPYNGSSLSILVSYRTYPDYWTFYWAAAVAQPQVGTAAALGSRLFSRRDVQDLASLRNMVEVIAGTPEQFASNNFELVGGGAVFSDASDPFSGVNPAWRISYFDSIVAEGWAPNSPQSVIDAVYKDITYHKVAAMKQQAPETGAYMNEADRLDPDFEIDFYGSHYSRLSSIKAFRDPTSVFYCSTCVGSTEWEESSSGVLCPRRT